MSIQILEGHKLYGWAFTINVKGGMTDELENYIATWLDTMPFIKTWVYKIEVDASQPHMHGGVLFEYDQNGHGKNKFGEWFRTYLASPKGAFRDLFWTMNNKTGKMGNNPIAVVIKTWYKKGWHDEYMLKKGVKVVTHCQYNELVAAGAIIEYLAEDIPEDQRRQTIPRQQVLYNKFVLHELPYETLEEVATSLSSLQFKHRCFSIVHERERVNLIVSTWCFIHEYEGDPEDVKLDYLEGIKLKRHKRKLELDSKYEDEYAKKMARRYASDHREIDRVNDTVS